MADSTDPPTGRRRGRYRWALAGLLSAAALVAVLLGTTVLSPTPPCDRSGGCATAGSAIAAGREPARAAASRYGAPRAPARPRRCPARATIIRGGDLHAGLMRTRRSGTLCLAGGAYRLTRPLRVDRPVAIVGVRGARIAQAFTGPLFEVRASGTTIVGLTMRGAHRRRTGEECAGTTAIQAAHTRGLRVAHNRLTNFTCGIQVSDSRRFTVSRNSLAHIKYAGVSAFSASNGLIANNSVRNVNADGPLGQNAYGIAVSGRGSRRVGVSRNRVDHAPTWECYDTHGGRGIDFVSNVCVAPGRVGINLEEGDSGQPSGRVVGNRIEAGGLTSAWNSVVLTGTGTVSDNVIIGFMGCRIFAPRASVTMSNRCS